MAVIQPLNINTKKSVHKDKIDNVELLTSAGAERKRTKQCDIYIY